MDPDDNSSALEHFRKQWKAELEHKNKASIASTAGIPQRSILSSLHAKHKESNGHREDESIDRRSLDDSDIPKSALDKYMLAVRCERSGNLTDGKHLIYHDIYLQSIHFNSAHLLSFGF